MSIPIIGKCFETSRELIAYLDGVTFNLWRPRFVTMHHTGGPDLKTWQGWQTRAKPVTDEQWMRNLAVYYGSPPPHGPADGPWSAGPHFFFTPKHFCVLSPPNKRGVHAKSFNAISWAVECVGNFDSEKFDGPVRDKYIEGLAALHVASGLQLVPFTKGVRGLHFHRDDPKTSKTCPGKNVAKDSLVAAVQKQITAMTGGAHEDEKVTEKTAGTVKTGTAAVDDLKVRAAASGKAPVLASLSKGTKVTVFGEAMNGDTRWLSTKIGSDTGWVAARFVVVA